MSISTAMKVFAAIVLAGTAAMISTPARAYTVGGSPNGVSRLTGTSISYCTPAACFPLGGASGCGAPLQITVEVTNGNAKVTDAKLGGYNCVPVVGTNYPWPLAPATGPGYTPSSTPINPANPANNVLITGVTILAPFGTTCTGSISKADLNSMGNFWFNQTFAPGCRFIVNGLTSSPPLLP